jgi:ribonuclease-3 family protein
MNALVLAFIGDALMTLCVRTDAALGSARKSGALQKETAGIVNARAQAAAAAEILPFLGEDERAVYMRARNGKTKNTAKNAAVSEYRNATGLEAVIGFLYVTGKSARIEELFSARSSF